jgi:hypothetical protein
MAWERWSISTRQFLSCHESVSGTSVVIVAVSNEFEVCAPGDPILKRPPLRGVAARAFPAIRPEGRAAVSDMADARIKNSRRLIAPLANKFSKFLSSDIISSFLMNGCMHLAMPV